MTKHHKELFQLLETSHQFLASPDEEGKWIAFQKALETVKEIEKAESLLFQEQLRRRRRTSFWNRLLLRSSAAIALILVLGVVLFSMNNNELLLLAPNTTLTATLTDTPTASPSRTISPVIPTASPTLALTPSATVIPLLTSGEITGRLTHEIPSKQHIFRGQQEDVVTIQLNSQDFDPNLTILDSKGIEISSNDDCGSVHKACVGPIQLPADDVYSIVVDSFTRRETGSYTLLIEVTHSTSSTMTPSPTPNCPANPPTVVIVTKESSVRLHDGHGQSYSVIGFVYNNECFALIGRNANDSW